jgi:hypothetical protein
LTLRRWEMLETIVNFILIATLGFALGIAVCVVFVLWLLRESEHKWSVQFVRSGSGMWGQKPTVAPTQRLKEDLFSPTGVEHERWRKARVRA